MEIITAEKTAIASAALQQEQGIYQLPAALTSGAPEAPVAFRNPRCVTLAFAINSA